MPVQRLYDTGRVAEATCWAHVRRKSHDIRAAERPPIGQEALTRIAALYAIETQSPANYRTYAATPAGPKPHRC